MNHPGRKMNTLFLIMLVGYIAASVLLSMLAQRSIGPGLIATLMIGELTVVVPGIVFLLLYRCNIAEWIPIRPVKGATIGFTFLLTFLIQPLLYFLNVVSQLFETNVAADLLLKLDDVPETVLLLTIGVLAPICEEVTFRGILFTGFRRTNRIFGSILWTAFLFGLFHMNLNQFGYAMMIGIVSAFLVEATGSLIPSLILHILINSYNVLQMIVMKYASRFFGEDLSALMDSSQDMITTKTLLFMSGAMLIPATGFTVLAVVVYIAILNREGTKEHVKALLPFFGKREEREMEQGSRIITVTGIIGVAICLFMIFGFDKVLEMLGV